MAALVFGLGMSVTSCNDDDNNNEEKQQKEAEAKAEASEKFWSVVGQLISYTDIVDDYEDKAFESNVGRPADNDPLTRIVGTNSMEAAVQSYNELTGANITTSTASDTYSDPDVGTLTWTKTTDGTSWGTVEVNIKQLPRLQKIVYQSFEQGNNNGYFSGKAYYRFGDVIQFGEGTDADYWICVRPAFGPEKKEDSHWVNIGELEDENIYFVGSDWDKSPYTFWLPTKLGTNKEHMQGFAEMLCAIADPVQWEYNVLRYCNSKDDLPFFHDFSLEKANLHNQYFWQNVQDVWVQNNVITEVLKLSGLNDLKKIVKDGVHLMYNGYSWPWGSTCKLYEAVYTEGSKNSEKNLHHQELLTPKKDMSKASRNIDFRQGGSVNYYGYQDFFDNDEKIRWVIRHATGAELSKKFGNGKYHTQQPIPQSADFYRYYRHVVPTENLIQDHPEAP